LSLTQVVAGAIAQLAAWPDQAVLAVAALVELLAPQIPAAVVAVVAKVPTDLQAVPAS
jgi:hypothetical protein